MVFLSRIKMWLSIVFFLTALFQSHITQPPLQHPPWYRNWYEGIQWMGKSHDPVGHVYYIPREIKDAGVSVPEPWNESPDFRLPEPPWVAMFAKDTNYNVPRLKYVEWNRPYRIFPTGKRTVYSMKYSWQWYRAHEGADRLQCICCTVYKRLTPLAICAVLTAKHLLTTATATELVLRRHPKKNTLENILGAYYHVTEECELGSFWGLGGSPTPVQNCFNSSTYMTPSRIHYHHRWVPPERTNRSHPLPTTMDLALWVSTFPFQTWKWYACPRGTSSAQFVQTPGLYHNGLYFIVGVQFVWDLRRLPMPWFMYAVKVRIDMNRVDPCPKVEWGWFMCIQSRSYAQLGLDSGAALFFTNEGLKWHNDWKSRGLIALNALSMRLRSEAMVHYFQPLDNHPVLDWLYMAYNGRLAYRFLDSRFNDTQWGSPKPKPWAKIVWGMIWTTNHHYWIERNVNNRYPHWIPWH